MNVYADYAEYYDLLYHDKDYPQEARFVSGLIRQYAPNAKTILNLGCGTGVHDVALAGLGYDVLGADLSPQMIACAERRRAGQPPEIQARLSFTVGDARRLAAGRSFDAVTSLFHVICYQTTDADLADMLATARRHLAPGAPFVFDFWHGPALADEGPHPHREKTAESAELKIHRIARSDWHPNEDKVTVNYDVAITRKASGEVVRLEEHHYLRYLFIPKLETLLQSAGFAVAQWGEWLTGAPPKADSFGVYAVALAR
ncbi:MAG TPA: class I SAM-dependent methyltransferase [Rhizomicrobium sp.]|jgi:SAM-dependent methyltransferase|nr:class I SAM-dependent methyltransferase [Rhizomicrobium sp.]